MKPYFRIAVSVLMLASLMLAGCATPTRSNTVSCARTTAGVVEKDRTSGKGSEKVVEFK
jgi:uncharacterized lipoprotein YajG